MEKLLILDANSIVNRAFYAVKLLTAKDGFHTNAIFGFLNILFKYTEEINPDYIAAAFDLPVPTFRHKMYDGYKATRHKMPEELAEQIPMLKEVLTAMHIKIYEKPGFEADDIIGTAARVCTEENVCCCVLTGDRDDLQLASQNVLIHLVTTRKGTTVSEIYDDKKVFEKYGVTPEEFIDLKAIMGDSSDNIPGVRGIGEKGATALIQAFHSVDGIYNNLDSERITKSIRVKLENGKDDAYMSKTLAAIDRNVPIDISVFDMKIKQYDNGALFDLFSRLEFRSFIKKLGLAPESVTKTESRDIFGRAVFEEVSDRSRLTELLNQDAVCFLTDRCVEKIAFCADDMHAYCAEFVGNEDIWKFFFESGLRKITHGLKNTLLYLRGFGIDVKNVDFDTEIAAYLLNPSGKSYDISDLAESRLGIRTDSGGDGFTQLSLDNLSAETDGCMLLMKNALTVRALKEDEEADMESCGLTELFCSVEMPLVSVLVSMEEIGFTVDQKHLTGFGYILSAEQDNLKQEIFELAGHDFNINSTKQLAAVLFDELGLTSKKKTKSGYSTNAEVLERLRTAHPIVDKILEYRKISKLNSTYVDGLMAVIDKTTGKVHSSFNQTVTATGRISSTEPNLQNIPVRTELGREMRRMFVAESEDFVLVDADYSQIELRVLAHMADDENMIAAFRAGSDIHAATAAKVFGVSCEEVTDQMRSAAKAINFGLIYGMGEFSLSQDLNISLKEAKAYINDYLGSYPNVKKYMKDTVEYAKEHGYVTTMFGRRRNIPELRSSDYQIRSFGERAAMNAPVQGTAADIIKIAMINVSKRLEQENLKSRLILQVHDELIVEAMKTELDKVCNILKTEMENAASLSVPLKVDMKTGHSWYDTK